MNKDCTILGKGLNVAHTSYFNHAYSDINSLVFTTGIPKASRNGDTRSLMDFKTVITNPIYRCVGGYKRNINVFFLLAEAFWILDGRKDVALLKLFNSRMSDYSDDGKVFHAPYGWRLRQQGIPTDFEAKAFVGIDQIKIALNLLSKNPDDRRVVLQVWDASMDLGAQTRDIPCNDIVMLEIVNNHLNITIANRSNDLHWGLCTNVFQFSMLQELLANILGLPCGTQVHNSKNLHVYLSNEITQLLLNGNVSKYNDLYDSCEPAAMEYRYKSHYVEHRLSEFDQHNALMLDTISFIAADPNFDDNDVKARLRVFSSTLYEVYMLLKLYVNYKQQRQNNKTHLKEEINIAFLHELISLDRMINFRHNDYLVLAQNFFAARLNKHILDEEFSALQSNIGLY